MPPNKIIRVFLFFLFFSSTAYAGSQNIESAAQNYCNTYKPDSWKNLAKDAPIYEIFQSILIRQNNEITNTKFKAALAQIDNTDFSRFYISVKEKIDNLLGRPWQCESFDNFFMPTQTVIPLILGRVEKKAIDPNDKNTIIISLAHSGDILINNAPLASTKITAIRSAIESVINKRKVKDLHFVLYADSNSDGSHFSRILIVMSGLGIKDIDLIDY